MDMAGYREHISVSGILGVVYALMSAWLGFSFDQAILAGCLTWVAGMLPDLDSQSGRPLREIISLTAVLLPLLLMQHLMNLGGQGERVLLLSIVVYLLIRFVAPSLLGKLTVHRGMLHSVPALIIASELVFLGYPSSIEVKLMLACGVAIGFFSHLLLDELYSVQWSGVRIKFSKSAGSALKFGGRRFLPNVFAYAVLLFLTYASLVRSEVLPEPGVPQAQESLPAVDDPAPAFDEGPP
jgi:membrane-bound metal-dependent hydrolase YbcI (DUF457 family)